MATILVVGLVWRAPELWLFHGFATWKTHEIQHQLQMVEQMTHAKPQAPKPSGP